MKNNSINILIASDINYAPYYGVMLTSLFENNNLSSFVIYLITDETWTDKETRRFEKLCMKHNSSFIVLRTDVFSLIDVPLNPNHHVNKATYYNILASKILPNDIDKVIYMDGDMLVQGDISSLWDIDMTNYAMAAVWDSIAFDESVAVRLGYSPEHRYVNNGTSIYNLAYWREHNVDKFLLTFINEHYESLTFMDQDVENAVLAGYIKYLPVTYNFQVLFLTKYFSQAFTPEFMNEVLLNKEHPVIIHYNGGVKPWSWRYYALPYRKEWLRAYWKSPWFFAYKITPIGKYIKHLIKRVVRRKQLIQAQRNQYIPEAYDLC